MPPLHNLKAKNVLNYAKKVDISSGNVNVKSMFSSKSFLQGPFGGDRSFPRVEDVSIKVEPSRAIARANFPIAIFSRCLYIS